MSNRFVEKLGGFADLSSEDRKFLEAITARRRPVPAGQDLIREGDAPGPIFVILEGWACRYKIVPEGRRQIVAFLMPGDSCSLHVQVLDRMDHGIETLTPAVVAAIDRRELERIIESQPRIARALWSAQLIDEGTMREWIVSMGRRDAAARIAHLMCELYLRARNIGVVQDGVMELPLSQIVLADALGLTPVHVNRVVRRLRLEGAMMIRPGSLTILDPVLLAQIAGFDDNYLHRRLRAAA